jgi:serine/threonine protein phosphatase PrpC
MNLEITTRPPTHDTGHDRLAILRAEDRTLIALADGKSAGPASRTAAAHTVDELARCFRSGIFPDNSRDWEMVLEAIDQVVFRDPIAGETSALVMLVHEDAVVGASVGDSLAYIVRPQGEPRLLTVHRPSAPGIGTGLARPIGFGPVVLDGKLITRRAARIGARSRSSTIAVA